ncbi:MAG: carboxypeptidase-like regulatory domain-containing protein, partial [Prevotella sp.]|nr:carboxypeptidase-like regulatory domain-containing protein [Prevotella sp.]
MRNKSLLLAVLLVLCTSLSAQTITHSFRNTSMADALRYLSMASHQYLINFAYDDLEDFKVTTDVRNQTVPDAIRQIIGFYPIGMKVVDGGKDAQGKPFPDLIFVECIQKESRKLTGRVVDENGQPMEFVNVAVLNPRDSSFINGGVTTAAGDFVIPCKATDVLVSLTSVGYRRLVRHITTAHAGVLTMRPDAYSLKTVTVKGRRKVEHEDRNVYTFSDEEVKASREAQQLIATLPGLRIDVLSGQLATLSGKPLTILVNGIE